MECQPYLIKELELLSNVRAVVALGKIAFDAFLGTYPVRGLELPSPRPKFGHGVTYKLQPKVTLIGSYHPSQQNTQTGRLTPMMFESVFQQARMALRRE